MNPPTTPPRSNFADRLREFPGHVLAGDDIARHRGCWREMFHQRIGPDFNGRLTFEVGCFDAGFLCSIARRFPSTAFIGLDWKFKAIHHGASRIMDEGLQNVLLLRGRAQDVEKIFAEAEIDDLWVFHPEPCDEPNQLKNRLIAEPFLTAAHQVLRADGPFCLKTDHPGYYQWVLGLLGLPQPPWFEAAGPGRPAGAGSQRVRARDLMRPEHVPARSEGVLNRFEVVANSTDLWLDAAALDQLTTHAFAGTPTLFESRFVRKGMPIYYIELRRR